MENENLSTQLLQTCCATLCRKVENLKFCSKCKRVKYCSQACQQDDWELCHKWHCQLTTSTAKNKKYLHLMQYKSESNEQEESRKLREAKEKIDSFLLVANNLTTEILARKKELKRKSKNSFLKKQEKRQQIKNLHQQRLQIVTKAIEFFYYVPVSQRYYPPSESDQNSDFYSNLITLYQLKIKSRLAIGDYLLSHLDSRHALKLFPRIPSFFTLYALCNQKTKCYQIASRFFFGASTLYAKQKNWKKAHLFLAQSSLMRIQWEQSKVDDKSTTPKNAQKEIINLWRSESEDKDSSKLSSTPVINGRIFISTETLAPHHPELKTNVETDSFFKTLTKKEGKFTIIKTPQFGFGVFAKEDLVVGEIVLSEYPISTCCYDFTSRCTFCCFLLPNQNQENLKKKIQMFECECKKERYCSLECQQKAWKTYHKSVCGLDFASFREGLNRNSISSSSQACLHIFNFVGLTMQASAWPCRTWNMIEFEHFISSNKKRKILQTSSPLELKILDQLQKMPEIQDSDYQEKDNKEEVDLSFFQSQLNDFWNHYLPILFNPFFDGEWYYWGINVLRLNGHSFCETEDQNLKNQSRGNCGVIGHLSSLFNHSCIPNVFWDYHQPSKTCQIQTLCNVRKGEQLFISYTPMNLDFETRKNSLNLFWGFECTCLLCQFKKPSSNQEILTCMVAKIRNTFETAATFVSPVAELKKGKVKKVQKVQKVKKGKKGKKGEKGKNSQMKTEMEKLLNVENEK